MAWKMVKLGDLLTESKVASEKPCPKRRIRVRLNVAGVEQRPVSNDKKGATKYYIRRAGQFVFGKQNFHKGAFGIIPKHLDEFESSADIPSFDVREDCLPEWIHFFFKSGNRYLGLSKLARGVGSKRIHGKQLGNIQIVLPPIKIQKDILGRINRAELSTANLSSEIETQKKLLAKYRQAVLQEAIEGKLTADWRVENPDVEPASELLTRIAAEKAELVKQKKIRKQKILPEIKPDEIPFDIPSTWQWCRLGELGHFCGGGTPSKSKKEYWHNGYISWVTPKDMKRQRIDSSQIQITQAGVDNSSAKIIPPMSLLFVVRGMILIHTFPVAINQTEVSVNQDMKAFMPFTYGMEDFFLMSLNSLSSAMLSLVRKSTHGTRRLEKESYINFLLPLPSLAEQEEIIRRVEAKFKLCDALGEQIQQAEQASKTLSIAILHELFDHTENNK